MALTTRGLMSDLGHDEAGVVEVELQEVLLAQRPPRLRQQPHQLLLLQRLSDELTA